MTDEKKKGGRPRADSPGVRVSTYMRVADYDRIVTLAKQRDDNSVSGTVRDLLKLRLK
jgi:hypothetical protein